MLPIDVMDITDALMRLEPTRTYAQRGAMVLCELARAKAYRLELADGRVFEGKPRTGETQETVAFALRKGKRVCGTLALGFAAPRDARSEDELRMVRWAARVFARGLGYAERIASECVRRSGEDVEHTLLRAPLSPREREVVALLVSGASTRLISKRTGLTVATVNTYVKRVCSKLHVHSRLELVARLAGTERAREPEGRAVRIPEADGSAFRRVADATTA